MDGLQRGMRTLLRGEVTRIGRDPHNEVSLRGENAAVVSARHAEVRREGDGYRLYDLASKNGAWLDGRRVESAELADGMRIRLGEGGPELAFELEWLPQAGVAETAAVDPASLRRAAAAGNLPALGRKPAPPRDDAPDGRPLGQGTAAILRRAIALAQRGAHRRWRRVVWGLCLALAGVLLYGGVTIWQLRRQKGDVDRQLADIEARLQAGGQDAREIRRAGAAGALPKRSRTPSRSVSSTSSPSPTASSCSSRASCGGCCSSSALSAASRRPRSPPASRTT